MFFDFILVRKVYCTLGILGVGGILHTRIQ